MDKDTHGQNGNRRCITLIEFLLVLIVLALLAGMLLPALSQSRGRARQMNVEPVVYHNTEEYDYYEDTPFRETRANPLSTFSIDVDTASYSNLRRFVTSGRLPPKDAIRIEEMVNYFDYAYPPPGDAHPFSLSIEQSRCPWNEAHPLVRIGLKGKALEERELGPGNLVFLLDVSGSMSAGNKLPLVRKAMKMLVKQLEPTDRVAIVTYAGSAGLALESTPASEAKKILRAIGRLKAGGSTAGSSGIKLAYDVVAENFIEGGNNRVILATDGDFNVGVSSSSELVRLIIEKRQASIYLTICGFGMDNYKDGRMEQISNAGNGNYFYIDSAAEARKVFVTDLRSNMYAIANDVKIQVEFNPLRVKEYRLIGYENRILAAKEFNDDLVDAGEMGPGHTVTALYELVPPPGPEHATAPSELLYQETRPSAQGKASGEIMTVKVRYKLPGRNDSHLFTRGIAEIDTPAAPPSNDFRFAGAVAALGMLLRESPHRGDLSIDEVIEIAESTVGSDAPSYRREFVELARQCAPLIRTAAN